ncbi:hypothetical protein WJX84_002464 [Apatococcus fuscideae]|uniref:Uncharacterized protein n=1 Tax=Apatococcus fuscideae TaxID=2026836 RepID=A0AAW1T8T2_9CHLO
MPEGGRIHDAADQASAEHQPRISHTPEKLQAEQPALRTFSEKVQQGLIGDFADDAMTEELFQLSTSANQTGSCRYEEELSKQGSSSTWSQQELLGGAVISHPCMAPQPCPTVRGELGTCLQLHRTSRGELERDTASNSRHEADQSFKMS